MEESVWILADEIVVDCIVVTSCIVVAEISDCLRMLFELACIIAREMQSYHRVCGSNIVSALNHSDTSMLRNHANSQSSLNSKENVVSSNDLCVDLAFSKSTDSGFCVCFQLIDKCNNTKNRRVFKELLTRLY